MLLKPKTPSRAFSRFSFIFCMFMILTFPIIKNLWNLFCRFLLLLQQNKPPRCTWEVRILIDRNAKSLCRNVSVKTLKLTALVYLFFKSGFSTKFEKRNNKPKLNKFYWNYNNNYKLGRYILEYKSLNFYKNENKILQIH